MVGTLTLFELRGAAELEAKLRDLGPKIARRLGDKALKAAAKPIIAEAKLLVPVRTGKLQRSITAVTSSQGRGNDERLVLIGFKRPASRYAHLVEFGTVYQSARPFIRPALDSQANAALNEMVSVLSAGIESAEYDRLSEGISESFFDEVG